MLKKALDKAKEEDEKNGTNHLDVMLTRLKQDPDFENFFGDLAYRYRWLKEEEQPKPGTFVAVILMKEGLFVCTKVPKEATVIGYSVVANDGSKEGMPRPYIEANPNGVKREESVGVVWLGHAYVKLEEYKVGDAVMVEQREDGTVCAGKGRGVKIGQIVNGMTGEAIIALTNNDMKEFQTHMEENMKELVEEAKEEFKKEIGELKKQMKDGSTISKTMRVEIDNLYHDMNEMERLWSDVLGDVEELKKGIEELMEWKDRVKKVEETTEEHEMRIANLEEEKKKGNEKGKKDKKDKKEKKDKKTKKKKEKNKATTIVKNKVGKVKVEGMFNAGIIGQQNTYHL